MKKIFCPLIISLSVILSSFSAQATESIPLEVMAGQMIMAGFRGYGVDDDSTIIHDIRERHLGGVILFDVDMTRWFSKARNIKDPQQVRQLIGKLKEAAAVPLLVAVDQEGGLVQRLKAKYGFTTTPSAQELGASTDNAVFAAGKTVGKTLHDVGFNLNFAPVTDVNRDPKSPAIGALGRSFSANPERVAKCATLFLNGMATHKVIGCLKHFPGHGSAGTDSHKGVTNVTKTWSASELVPYRELIAQGNVKVIMTAHIFNAQLDPEFPATLSPKVINGLLRTELGYDGVVITDDLDMGAIADEFGRTKAIQRAIEAGADILLFGNNIQFDPNVVKQAHTTIIKLVREGTIPRERIQASYDRIMKLKHSL